MIIDYPWYYVLLCLLAGALYAGLLYFAGRKRFGARMRWLLAGVRFVAVSLIALLLLAPMARQRVHERQRPVVVVAQDVSQSVLASADSSFRLELEESGNYETVYETFGGGVTDIGGTLADIASRYAGRNVGAVVLASDGIANRGPSAPSVAEGLPFPVHTVALGDTTPRRDAAIGTPRFNHIAFLGNQFPVEVTVTASLLAGRTATLTASDAHGNRLASRQLSYTDDYAESVTLTLPAREPGLQRYELHLTVAEGEVERLNNKAVLYVDVIDGRSKVAIVGNAPHPDLAALKQAVESNHNYEATVMLVEEVESGKCKVDEGEWKVAVLHNLPSRSHAVPAALAELPLMVVIGCQTDLPRFNSMHLGMEINSGLDKTNDLTAVYNDRFTLFGLDAADARIIEQWPPLCAPFGMSRNAPDLQMLFTGRLGSIDTRQPLIAACVQGGRRCAFVWGEGLWRWRLNDYLMNSSHGCFDRLMSQLVTFTALSGGRERFVVEANRRYASTDDIVLRAQLYNEAYEPVNTPDASLSLRGDTLHADYNFARSGGGYSLDLGSLPEGVYRYHAATTFEGKEFVQEGVFAVEALQLEMLNLTADHSLLRAVSALTGGQTYLPGQMASLNAQLASLKPVIYTRTRHSDFLGMPLALVLILLLLAAEWVLRKYHGEI